MEAVEKVIDLINSGEKVTVVCEQGVSRSSGVMAATLIILEEKSFRES